MDVYIDDQGNYFDDAGNPVSQSVGNQILAAGGNAYDLTGTIQYAGQVDNNAIQAGSAQSGTKITTNNNSVNTQAIAGLIASSGNALGTTILAAQGRPVTTVLNPRTGLVQTSAGLNFGTITSSPIMLILLALLAYLLYKKLA